MNGESTVYITSGELQHSIRGLALYRRIGHKYLRSAIHNSVRILPKKAQEYRP